MQKKDDLRFKYLMHRSIHVGVEKSFSMQALLNLLGYNLASHMHRLLLMTQTKKKESQLVNLGIGKVE